MRISIRGLVKAARSAEGRLRDGISEGERADYLEAVGRQVEAARGILRRHGAGPGALPAPSKRAFEALERIAALAPETLPEPLPGTSPVRPIRVSHVVRSLEACQRLLTDAATMGDRSAIQEVAGMASRSVEGIEAVCLRGGTRPAGLPSRSRSAYAMLRWLAEDGNAGLYARQVETALAGLADGLASADPTGKSQAPVAVTFVPGRTLWRVRRLGSGTAWRLSAGFLAAEVEDFGRLACVARWRSQAPEPIRERLEAFVNSEPFRSYLLELDWLVEQETYRARGRAWDLDDLFERLDATLLGGVVERPHLHWWATLSETRFGLYLPMRDLVCISTRLDDPAVPEFVAEVVLYHELLHKKHPSRYENGRRRVHTPTFRADERRHPRWAEADEWLGALVRGEAAPRAGPS